MQGAGEDDADAPGEGEGAGDVDGGAEGFVDAEETVVEEEEGGFNKGDGDWVDELDGIAGLVWESDVRFGGVEGWRAPTLRTINT